MKWLSDIPIEKRVGQRVALVDEIESVRQWKTVLTNLGTVEKVFMNKFDQEEATVLHDNGKQYTYLAENLIVVE